MTLIRTVRTLEPRVPAQVHERLLRDHVAAGHHHRRVPVGRLLLGDGADEDVVEAVGRRERDFDLATFVSVCKISTILLGGKEACLQGSRASWSIRFAFLS